MNARMEVSGRDARIAANKDERFAISEIATTITPVIPALRKRKAIEKLYHKRVGRQGSDEIDSLARGIFVLRFRNYVSFASSENSEIGFQSTLIPS